MSPNLESGGILDCVVTKNLRLEAFYWRQSL